MSGTESEPTADPAALQLLPEKDPKRDDDPDSPTCMTTGVQQPGSIGEPTDDQVPDRDEERSSPTESRPD